MNTSVFDRYYMTTLNLSRSSDVLSIIKNDDELVSQGGNVIASYGPDNDGDNLWFNAVVFDEDDLTAVGKYSLGYEQYDPAFYINAVRKVRFDGELVLGVDVISEPYANDNARKMAILDYLFDNCQSSLGQVSEDSQDLRGSAMLVSRVEQSIKAALLASPAKAALLSEPGGLEFEQINMGESRVRMVIEDDVVKVKVKCGKSWFKKEDFEDHPDVINM